VERSRKRSAFRSSFSSFVANDHRPAANYYVPYAGSCELSGLGYGTHTIQLVNSPCPFSYSLPLLPPSTLNFSPPDEPGYVYLTGIHYTTNKTQPVWANLEWDACCVEYTFPDGVATSVSSAVASSTVASVSSGSSAAQTASATSTNSSNSGTSAFNPVTLGASFFPPSLARLHTDHLQPLLSLRHTFLASLAGWIIATVTICIILASLLVGCLCCRKRPSTGKASTSSLAAALKYHDSGASPCFLLRLTAERSPSTASKPLRKKRSARGSSSKHSNDDDETPSTFTESSDRETDGDTTDEEDISDEEKGTASRRKKNR
jgi:hypothetical protein